MDSQPHLFSYHVANHLLSALRIENPYISLDIANISSAVIIHNNIRFLDMPFMDKNSGKRCGFALISTSTNRQHALEYSVTGLSFIESIHLSLSKVVLRDKPFQITKVIYVSALSMFVDVNYDGIRIIVHLPTFDLFSTDEFDRIFSAFREHDVVSDDMLFPLDSVIGRNVALPAKPVRYRQLCSGNSVLGANDISTKNVRATLLANPSRTAPNSCAPNKIAGCAPVAMTVIFSLWRRLGFRDTHRIWASSSCWQNEWSSFPFPPYCPDVVQTLWQVHTAMNTSDNGSTMINNIIQGANVLRNFRIDWIPRTIANFFPQIKPILDGGQPLLWSSTGGWDLPINDPGAVHYPPGSDGHVVVVYGYTESVVPGAERLLVSLGWGSDFSDRSLFLNDYRENYFYYAG